MLTLEVVRTGIDPELIDPGYAQSGNLETHAPSLPVRLIGQLEETETFSRPYYPPALSALVKHKEQEDGRITYEIPENFSQFSEAIVRIATFEHSAYPQASYDSIRINADQQAVEPGKAQRAVVLHRDEYGRRNWAHFYVVSNVYPTEFLAFEEATGRVSYKQDEETPAGISTSAEPYQIAAANKTAFHRSPIVSEHTSRTFLRATYVHNLL